MLSPLEAFLLFQIAYWSISGASFVITFIRGTFYKTTRADRSASNVVLVIVTKASRKVKDSLHHTIDNVQYLAKKYNLDFKIIIDEGAELQSELESMYEINLIVVPKDYRPDLVGKGKGYQLLPGKVCQGRLLVCLRRRRQLNPIRRLLT